jgi:hypothetical protein
MTPGRGFTALNQKGERAAFGMWMRELIKTHGGRAKVAEITGISTDSLTKWMGGRAIPSKINIKKLIDGKIIPYESLEAMLAESPWMGSKYRKQVTAQKAEVDTYTQVQVEPVAVRHNLMDAVLTEPGLTSKQQAQLVAIIAMIVNGVDVQVVLSPR